MKNSEKMSNIFESKKYTPILVSNEELLSF